MNNYNQTPDEDLAALLLSGDRFAGDALLRRYAAEIYDLSLRITLDEAAALDATGAAFRRAVHDAASRAPALSYRAWLFGLARDTAVEGGRRGVRADASAAASTALDIEDERFAEPAGPDVDAEATAWAWQAARSLRPRDYALLDLSLRRGLTPGEIADVAGLSRNGVFANIGRLRGAFEEVFAGSALFSRGPAACPELAALTGAAGADPSVSLRRDILHHAESCAVCRETQATLPTAAEYFASLQLVVAPEELADLLAELLMETPAPSAAPADVEPEPVLNAPAAAEDDIEEDRADVDDDQPIESLSPFAAFEPELAGDHENGHAAVPTHDEADDDRWEPVAARHDAHLPEEEPVVAAVAAEQSPSPVERIRLDWAGAEAEPPPRRFWSRFSGGGSSDVPRGDDDGDDDDEGDGEGGGRSVWLLALLVGLTIVAAYVGFALGHSIQGGKSSASGGGRITCGNGPTTVDRGSSINLTFDPSKLPNYQILTLVTEPVSNASSQAVAARTLGPLQIYFQSLPLPGIPGRTDEYRLLVTFGRGAERTTSICTVQVKPAPPGAPSIPGAVPAAPAAPAGSPAAATTPVPVRTP